MTTLPTEPVAARPYYAAAFLMDVSLSLTVMAFPWIATRQYHASPELVGDLSGLMTGLYTIVALSAGVLSRKLTPRTRMLGAACGVFVSYGAAAASHSLAQLAAALCISWFIMGFYWPALQAQLCAGCPPDEIQRRLTRFNLSWSTGILTGPAIAGYLYARAPSLPLTTHLPLRKSAGDQALRSIGPETVFDAIEMLSDSGLERLKHYATGQHDKPLPGFWTGDEPLPDASRNAK